MAARQQVRERDRSEQVPDAQGDEVCWQSRSHGEGASASGIYVGPAGERRLSYKVTRSIRDGPAKAGISAISANFARGTRSLNRASVRCGVKGSRGPASAAARAARPPEGGEARPRRRGPKPQHPRRAALGKNSEPLKRQVERRLVRSDRASAVAHALFERGVGAAEKVQRQVHAIGTHPRGLRALSDRVRARRSRCGRPARASSSSMSTAMNNRFPTHPLRRRTRPYSVIHRLTMSSAACDA